MHAAVCTALRSTTCEGAPRARCDSDVGFTFKAHGVDVQDTVTSSWTVRDRSMGTIACEFHADMPPCCFRITGLNFSRADLSKPAAPIGNDTPRLAFLCNDDLLAELGRAVMVMVEPRRPQPSATSGPPFGDLAGKGAEESGLAVPEGSAPFTTGMDGLAGDALPADGRRVGDVSNPPARASSVGGAFAWVARPPLAAVSGAVNGITTARLAVSTVGDLGARPPCGVSGEVDPGGQVALTGEDGGCAPARFMGGIRAGAGFVSTGELAACLRGGNVGEASRNRGCVEP
mmetsp:Transcript_27520/g.75187  ORF Transcript_27520/g.75187 Transcript_27520/m.75187 type:complete len:288 (+) Transcript_27520:430-1293(+)